MRAERLVTVAKRERRPRPRLRLGWESERSLLSGGDFSGLPFPADDLRVDDEGGLLTFGFEIAVPLFDRRRGEIAGALADEALEEAGLEAARRDAGADVRRLVEQGRALAAAGEALEGAAAAGAANLETVRRAYDVGQLGLDQVLRERDRVLRSLLGAQDVAVALLETEIALATSVGALDVLGLDALADLPPPPDAAGAGAEP